MEKYWPIIITLFLAFALAFSVALLWSWFLTPSKIRSHLRRRLASLGDLQSRLCQGWLARTCTFLIALIISVGLGYLCFRLLHETAMSDTAPPLMRTISMALRDSWLSKNFESDVYRVVPFGALIAFVVGSYLGWMIGIAFGRNLALRRFLITQKLRASYL